MRDIDRRFFVLAFILFAATNFAAYSHQGAHDSIMWPHLDTHGMPAATSVDLDSANSAAPGGQPTDRLGAARYDDPGTSNAGAGPSTFCDRGAFEFQGDSIPTPAAPPRPPTPRRFPRPSWPAATRRQTRWPGFHWRGTRTVRRC